MVSQILTQFHTQFLQINFVNFSCGPLAFQPILPEISRKSSEPGLHQHHIPGLLHGSYYRDVVPHFTPRYWQWLPLLRGRTPIVRLTYPHSWSPELWAIWFPLDSDWRFWQLHFLLTWLNSSFLSRNLWVVSVNAAFRSASVKVIYHSVSRKFTISLFRFYSLRQKLLNSFKCFSLMLALITVQLFVLSRKEH